MPPHERVAERGQRHREHRHGLENARKACMPAARARASPDSRPGQHASRPDAPKPTTARINYGPSAVIQSSSCTMQSPVPLSSRYSIAFSIFRPKL